MRVWWVLLVFVSAAYAEAEIAARAARAKQRAVAFLRGRQTKEGSWSATTNQTAPQTALCLFALASAGVPADDPAIVRCLSWVDSHGAAFDIGANRGTEAASYLVLALVRLDRDGFRARIQELTDRIVRSQKNRGYWDFPLGKFSTSAGKPSPHVSYGRGDGHNTARAVHALLEGGGTVPRRTWERVYRMYRKTQTPRGGWTTGPGFRNDVSVLVAAGIVGYLGAAKEIGRDVADDDKTLRRARGALAKIRIADTGHPRGSYAFLRVARALDLAPDKWAAPAALSLLASQLPDGGWGVRRRGGLQSVSERTAYAVLFFSMVDLSGTPARRSSRRTR